MLYNSIMYVIYYLFPKLQEKHSGVLVDVAPSKIKWAMFSCSFYDKKCLSQTPSMIHLNRCTKNIYKRTISSTATKLFQMSLQISQAAGVDTAVRYCLN